jgi:hypothetical protein
MFIRLLTLAFTAVLVVGSTDVYAMGGRGRSGGGGSNNNGGGYQGDGYSGGDSSYQTLYLGDDANGTTGTYHGSDDHLASAPEPATLLLLASGAAGAISWRARRKK